MSEEIINDENETGLVVQVEGGEILVECEPKKMCVGCAVKDSCLMSGDSDEKKRLIWMDNTIDAAAGDLIVFRIDAKGVVYASMMLYLIPVVFLFAGMYLGYKFNIPMGLEEDGASALGGVLMLFLSFLIVRILSRITSQKSIFKPQALEKMKSC